ncbi:hypothetical protein [Bacillus toyonensis]|uniref:hypothetical protein n=1 Tax=Bacillus toyonensis TaxID=155322 RepID=UPI000BFCB7D1|nr:hypothetical protein [Bacillus toyonensis]PHG64238.1 hypothetical protein COI59_17085 [Bacillus toyonensis]
MNKGDAILRLLSEIKLELKEAKEQVEQMQIKLDTFEQQNQVKNKVEQKKQKTKINAVGLPPLSLRLEVRDS